MGGGLAGLFLASELMSLGVEDLVLVEESPAPGGVARTVKRNGFALEPGAGSFLLPHDRLGPILDRAGVESVPAADAGVRHVFTGGRLVEVAATPRMLTTPLLSWPAKLRALGEVLVPARTDPDESIAAFCRRRFGGEAGALMAWLMASGVYAGDPERLAVGAAFPGVAEMERAGGSVIRSAVGRRRARHSEAPTPRLHVPVGGMAALAERIAATLGERFRPGFGVGSVEKDGERWVVSGSESLITDRVVLAIPPHRAAMIADEALAAHLVGATTAPVAVLALGGAGPSPLPRGFGALVGPDEGMATLGVLYESSYAPERAPAGSWLVKVIAGGAANPQVMGASDHDLAARAIREAGRIVGADLSPSFVESVRHRPGIPQYEVGHLDWLRRIDSLLESRPGLHVTGWGYRGVGVVSLAVEAARLAREIAG